MHVVRERRVIVYLVQGNVNFASEVETYTTAQRAAEHVYTLWPFSLAKGVALPINYADLPVSRQSELFERDRRVHLRS